MRVCWAGEAGERHDTIVQLWPDIATSRGLRRAHPRVFAGPSWLASSAAHPNDAMSYRRTRPAPQQALGLTGRWQTEDQDQR
jgi:hypothetical protein